MTDLESHAPEEFYRCAKAYAQTHFLNREDFNIYARDWKGSVFDFFIGEKMKRVFNAFCSDNPGEHRPHRIRQTKLYRESKEIPHLYWGIGASPFTHYLKDRSGP